MTATVIGVGNPFRRDDGIGPAVVEAIARLDRPGVTTALSDGEPTQLIEAWTGMDLAIVIDAVRCDPAAPGRVHRTGLDDLAAGTGQSSSHGLGIPEAVELARVLDLLPARLVVYAVEAGDVDFGTGLSVAVAAAVPTVVAAVVRELDEA
jgi:hydrogenase maturation protease